MTISTIRKLLLFALVLFILGFIGCTCRFGTFDDLGLDTRFIFFTLDLVVLILRSLGWSILLILVLFVLCVIGGSGGGSASRSSLGLFRS